MNRLSFDLHFTVAVAVRPRSSSSHFLRHGALNCQRTLWWREVQFGSNDAPT